MPGSTPVMAMLWAAICGERGSSGMGRAGELRRPLECAVPDCRRAHPTRNQAIIATYATGGCARQTIADYVGPPYAEVSRIVEWKRLAHSEQKTDPCTAA